MEPRMFCPLHIGNMLRTNGHKIYGFSILVSEEEAETLYEVVRVFKKYGVKLIQIMGSTPLLVKKGYLTYVVGDFTDSEIEPQTLAEEIRRLSSIEDVCIIAPIDDLLVNMIHFPLFVGDSRAMIINEPFMRAIIRRPREHFGSGVEAYQYYEGKFIGESIYNALSLFIKGREKLIEGLRAYLISIGLAVIELIELNPDKPLIVIRAYDSFECELGKGSDRPYSHVLRGILAGFLGRVLNENLIAREVRCIAKGDEYCEYEITREEEEEED